MGKAWASPALFFTCIVNTFDPDPACVIVAVLTPPPPLTCTSHISKDTDVLPTTKRRPKRSAAASWKTTSFQMLSRLLHSIEAETQTHSLNTSQCVEIILRQLLGSLMYEQQSTTFSNPTTKGRTHQSSRSPHVGGFRRPRYTASA